jgi:hypothetical protein
MALIEIVWGSEASKSNLKMTDKKVIYDAIFEADDRGLDHDAMITELAANPAVREFLIRILVEQVVFHVREEIAAIDRGVAVLDGV